MIALFQIISYLPSAPYWGHSTMDALKLYILEPAPNTIPQFALNHPRYLLERGFAAQGRQHADLLER